MSLTVFITNRTNQTLHWGDTNSGDFQVQGTPADIPPNSGNTTAFSAKGPFTDDMQWAPTSVTYFIGGLDGGPAITFDFKLGVAQQMGGDLSLTATARATNGTAATVHSVDRGYSTYEVTFVVG